MSIQVLRELQTLVENTYPPFTPLVSVQHCKLDECERIIFQLLVNSNHEPDRFIRVDACQGDIRLLLETEAPEILNDTHASTHTCLYLYLSGADTCQHPEYLVVQLLAMLVNVKGSHEVQVTPSYGWQDSYRGEIDRLVLAHREEQVDCHALLHTLRRQLYEGIACWGEHGLFLVGINELVVLSLSESAPPDPIDVRAEYQYAAAYQWVLLKQKEANYLHPQ